MDRRRACFPLGAFFFSFFFSECRRVLAEESWPPKGPTWILQRRHQTSARDEACFRFVATSCITLLPTGHMLPADSPVVIYDLAPSSSTCKCPSATFRRMFLGCTRKIFRYRFSWNTFSFCLPLITKEEGYEPFTTPYEREFLPLDVSFGGTRQCRYSLGCTRPPVASTSSLI